jgi:hypothetical protein
LVPVRLPARRLELLIEHCLSDGVSFIQHEWFRRDLEMCAHDTPPWTATMDWLQELTGFTSGVVYQALVRYIQHLNFRSEGLLAYSYPPPARSRGRPSRPASATPRRGHRCCQRGVKLPWRGGFYAHRGSIKILKQSHRIGAEHRACLLVILENFMSKL